MSKLKFLKNMKFWVVMGLVGFGLFQLAPVMQKSPFNFPEIVLLIIFIFLLWINRNGALYRIFHYLQGRRLSYVLLSWGTAMLVELTLSTSPGNIGGLHEKTIPSFILAQGFYWFFAIFGLFLIRRYHYSLNDLYLASIAAAMTEGIVFNRIILSLVPSPLVVVTPFIIGYYGLIYGIILCLPLLIIDPQSLWSSEEMNTSLSRKVVYGFLMAFITYLLFVGWASLASFIFSGFKNF